MTRDDSRVERHIKGYIQWLHENGHPMQGKHHSLKTRRLMSKVRKQMLEEGTVRKFNSNESRQHWIDVCSKKFSGKGNPMWKGGLSFEPYGLEFNESLRERIRERDSHACRLCGIKQDKTKHPVHHIDYNKRNNKPKNLITLCKGCHSLSNNNREFWINFFMGKNKFLSCQNDKAHSCFDIRLKVGGL